MVPRPLSNPPNPWLSTEVEYLDEIPPAELVVYGTVLRGMYRRYARTPVLAQWQTLKKAFRVTLEDSTTLVASGDHRFLTERGWKYVTGRTSGASRRPHLTAGNSLLGTGAFAQSPPRDVDYRRGYLRFFHLAAPCIVRKRDIEGRALKNAARLRVMSVEPLGIELPMYDITPERATSLQT